MRKILYKLVFILCSFTLANAQEIKKLPILLKNISIYDTENDSLRKDQNIYIEDGVIVDISDSIKHYPNADFYDCSNKIAINGLWDLNAKSDRNKSTFDFGSNSNNDNIKYLLRSGILHSIESGKSIVNISPKIIYPYFNIQTDDYVVVNSVKRAKNIVVSHAESGLKILRLEWYQLNNEELSKKDKKIIEEIIKTAQINKIKVWFNSNSIEYSKVAIKLGIDVLTMLPSDAPMDSEFVHLAKKTNLLIIPSVGYSMFVNEIEQGNVEFSTIELLNANPYKIGFIIGLTRDNRLYGNRIIDQSIVNHKVENLLSDLKLLKDSSMNYMIGSMSSNYCDLLGFSIHRDMSMLHEVGYTNKDIIKAATSNLQNYFGIDIQVKVGSKANFLVLNSNPVADLDNYADIYMAFSEGKMHHSFEIFDNTPTDLTQIQLNSYNQRNIEAFMSVYSDSIMVYTFPNILEFQGKTEMEKKYIEYFNKAGASLYCNLDDRLQYHDYVFDKETIYTEIKGRETFTGQAIYQIKDGKIYKIWFIK